ncbi:diguanylate cyclase domain-containing protein [Azospirillum sp. ST 5-10]|uniref:diguanylate cyclase domain-containing protein n=1 Tax=unclassified Azospirillum TaxID=2630922 RepID=UPI003F4A0752
MPLRPKTTLLALGLAATLGVGVLLALDARRGYDAVLRDAARTAGHAALLAEEHALRVLAPADLLVRQTVERVAELGLQRFATSEEEWRRTHRLADALPTVTGVAVIDADGLAVFSTAAFPAVIRDVADRPAVLAHRAGAPLFVGAPEESRAPDGPAVTVSRPLAAAGGGFAGAAVADVAVDQFRAFYRAAADRTPMVIALVRGDGALIVREPAATRVVDPDRLSGQVAAALAAGRNEGLLEAVSPVDGVRRLFAFRGIAGLPLVVVAGIAVDDVLAAWWPEIWRNALLFAGALAGIGLLTAAGLRGMAAETAAHGRVAQDNAFTHDVLDALSTRLAILDAGGNIVATNRAWRTDSAATSAGAALRDGGNYLAACDSAGGTGSESARAAAEGIRAVIAGERTEYVLDHPAPTAAGMRWHNMRVRRLNAPAADAPGQGLVVVSLDDVTHVVEAREALLKSQEEVRRSEALYRTIAANLPNGAVAVFDRDLRFRFADGRGLADIGLEPARIVGRTVGELFDAAACRVLEPLCRDVLSGVQGEGEVAVHDRAYRLFAIPLPDPEDPGGAGLLLMQDITRLRRAQEAMEALNHRLAELSATDGLLGIANRRRFDTVLETEWRRAARTGDPLGMLMVDVDFFKAFNDAYGHLEGDRCLKAIADAVASAATRPADLVARYGGEEIAVILPGTGIAGARRVAQRIHENIRRLNRPFAASPTGDHVTVSIGAAALVPDNGTAAEALVAAADRALYLAKAGGRNRTVEEDGPVAACGVGTGD